LIDVSWLEQGVADLPAADDWLSASEAVRLSGMRFPKRRADWRLGRWTAKRALAACLNLAADPRSLARIEIRPAPSGAPEVFVGNGPAPVTISISHRAGWAACAVAGSEAALGCDLEVVEPRSDAFAADYFTAQEQQLLAQASPADRFRLLALLWSGKESALKALRVGLRLDTRCVVVDPFLGQGSGGSDWRPLCVHYNGQALHGWWRQTGNLVRTLVAAPVAAAPHTFQA
jgi:4'-phosphopantetheinyl transferase